MATTTQTNTGVGAAARPVDWGRWLYWLLAAALVTVGAALLALELNLLPGDWARPLAVGGPAVVMATGAGLTAWGWPGRRRSLPAFALERGGAATGELVVVTGSQDFTLRAFAGTSQLAVGEFPNRRGPRMEVKGTNTRLTLEPRMVVPYLAGGPWGLAAAKGLPWTLDVHAGGGHLDLNLRELTVAGLKVHSAYGNVGLTLPAQAPAELQLRLALGDLAVTVPEGVEAKLRLVVGGLVNVSVDERRFINVGASEWMTPLYPTTAQRCTVVVDMWAGDLTIA